MSAIPPELYRSIIENIDEQPTLYTLLFVSRNWSREAERHLYKSVTIPRPEWSENPMTSQPEEHKQKEMLITLLRSPRLMSYLENLDLSGLKNQDGTNLMLSISQGCPNLKSLLLPFEQGQSFIPPPNACFRLRVFDFGSIPRSKRRILGHGDPHGIRPFLESQPEIRVLLVPSWILLEPLPPYALPNLRALIAPIQICSWLLPKRPVEELMLSIGVTNFFFEGFGHLPYLKQLRFTLPFENLVWFANCFGQLEHLEIALVCGFLSVQPWR